MLTKLQLIEQSPPLAINSNTPITLLQVLDDPTVGADVLLPTVERDVNLTVGLLRICNSCLFAGNREIGSVREALVRVGNLNFARIAFIVSLEPVFSHEMAGYGMDTNALWHHSLAVAYASSRFAVEMGAERVRERAFTAGIMHDIGKLTLDSILAGQQDVLPGKRVEPDAERRLAGVDHAEIGGAILNDWQLPEDVIDAVIYHHTFDYSGAHKEIVRSVQAADTVIQAAQGFMEPGETEEAFALFETWGLAPDNIEDTRVIIARAGNDILPVLLARRR